MLEIPVAFRGITSCHIRREICLCVHSWNRLKNTEIAKLESLSANVPLINRYHELKANNQSANSSWYTVSSNKSIGSIWMLSRLP
jgi:hypothetical protein